MLADIYKLMYGTHAAKYCPIADGNMSGYLCIIAHDAIIAHNAIMCQVAISHKQAIFTYLRFFFYSCAAVHRYKLTNRCAITNIYVGIFTLEFQILRNGSNYSTWKNAAVLTNSCPFHNSYIGPDPCSITHLHILMDYSKRINLYIGSKPCIRMNICMRMNHAVIYKTFPRHGRGERAKLTVAAKNKTFFGYSLLKLRVSGYSVFIAKENQPLQCKFVIHSCITLLIY